MVRYRRNFLEGGTFFFTVALADRQSSWLTSHVSILRAAFRQARSEQPFHIDGIVVLPDHIHAVFTLPQRDADYPARWRLIKTLFTRGLLQTGADLPQRDVNGRNLWQRRFWEHTIRDDIDFSRHIAYVHFNPVKHGFVSSPADWPHSSLHRFIRHGMAPQDWGAAAENDDAFGEPH